MSKRSWVGVFVFASVASAGEWKVEEPFETKFWTETDAGFELSIDAPDASIDVTQVMADPYVAKRRTEYAAGMLKPGPFILRADAGASIFLVDVRRPFSTLSDQQQAELLVMAKTELDSTPPPPEILSDFFAQRASPFSCADGGLDAVDLKLKKDLISCADDSTDFACVALRSLSTRADAALRAAVENKSLAECHALEAAFLAGTRPPDGGDSTRLRDFLSFKSMTEVDLRRELAAAEVLYLRTEIPGPGDTFFKEVEFGESTDLPNPAVWAFSYIAVKNWPHRLKADLSWSTQAADPNAAIQTVATLAGFAIATYAGVKPSPKVVSAEAKTQVLSAGIGSNTETVASKEPKKPKEPKGNYLAMLLARLKPVVDRGTRFIGPIQTVPGIQYQLSILETKPVANSDGKFGAAVQQVVTYSPRELIWTLVGGLQGGWVSDDVAVDHVWRPQGPPGGTTQLYALRPERQPGRYFTAVFGIFVGHRLGIRGKWSLGGILNFGVPLAGPAPLPQATLGVALRMPNGLLVSGELGARTYLRSLDTADGTSVLLGSKDTVPVAATVPAVALTLGLSLTFDLAVVGSAILEPFKSIFAGSKS